jgi:uncharacterized membrane protein
MESVAEAQASAGSDPESQRRATTIAVGRELFSFAAGEAGAGIGAITCIEAGPLSVVCGVIGGVIGGFAGEEAGEAIAEELSSAISTAIGAVSDAINHLIYPGYSSVLTPLMSRF